VKDHDGKSTGAIVLAEVKIMDSLYAFQYPKNFASDAAVFADVFKSFGEGNTSCS
jgi:hypothetical protein